MREFLFGLRIKGPIKVEGDPKSASFFDVFCLRHPNSVRYLDTAFDPRSPASIIAAHELAEHANATVGGDYVVNCYDDVVAGEAFIQTLSPSV